MARSKENARSDIMRVLESRDREAEPFLTASAIAEIVEPSRPTVTKRLRELEERGEVKKREVGRAVVWWPASEDMQPTNSNNEGDKIEADPADIQRAEWAGKVEKYAGGSILLLVTSSILFSAMFLYGTIGPGTVTNALTGVLLIAVVLSSALTLVFTLLYWSLEAGLHRTLSDNISGAVAEAEDNK